MSDGSGTALPYPHLAAHRLVEMLRPEPSISEIASDNTSEPEQRRHSEPDRDEILAFRSNEEALDSIDLGHLTGEADQSQCSQVQPRDQEITAKEWGKVYGQAYALTGNYADAEDVVQESYLQLFQAGLKGKRIESTAKWMRGVVRYVAIYMFRKSRPDLHVSFESERRSVENAASLVQAAVGAESIEDRLVEEALIRASLQVISQLPDRERECILMYTQGYSFVQIAKALGIPYHTALKTTKRAILQVRGTIRR